MLDSRPRLDSLLSPNIPTDTRNRSTSVTSAENDGDESSDDDSVLSWWSSDDSDEEIGEEKEAERKRREVERQKILSSAGLKLRREPPGIPNRPADRKTVRRRPAPAAPKKRRRAPAVPSSSETEQAILTPSPESEEQDPQVETQDAYARYETFLAQPRIRATTHERPMGPERPLSVVSTQSASTALSPSTSIMSSSTSKDKDHGSRLTGFFSRMMAPTTSNEKTTSRISGPITRLDTPTNQDERGGEEEFGKTWSSLVDPGLLESMSGKERKRQEVSGWMVRHD